MRFQSVIRHSSFVIGLCLSLVTRHSSPAAPADYVNILVRSNGVLVAPTNFFIANAAAMNVVVSNTGNGTFNYLALTNRPTLGSLAASNSLTSNNVVSINPSQIYPPITGGSGTNGGTPLAAGFGISVTTSNGYNVAAVTSPVATNAVTMISPLDFGAYADGTHDDTAAISNALNAAQSRNLGVWLGSSRYLVSGTIYLYSGMSLIGNGACLYFTGATPAASGAMLTTFNLSSNITVSGIEIAGNFNTIRPGSDDGRIGLLIWNCQNPGINIQNLYIHGFGTGFEVYGAGANISDRAQISGIVSCVNYRGLKTVAQAEYISFTRITCNENHIGLEDNGGNSLFSACDFSRNDINLYAYSVTDYVSYNSGHHPFVGCAFNHAATAAVNITNLVYGMTFSGCAFLPPIINITNSANIGFNNCLFGWGNTNLGFALDHCTNISVVAPQNPYVGTAVANNQPGYSITQTACVNSRFDDPYGNISALSFTGNGSALSNLSGAKITAGTVNSNALDAATLGMFGTGSSSLPESVITNSYASTFNLSAGGGITWTTNASVNSQGQASFAAVNVNSGQFYGNGGGLTNLNASNINTNSSLVVSNATFSGTITAGGYYSSGTLTWGTVYQLDGLGVSSGGNVLRVNAGGSKLTLIGSPIFVSGNEIISGSLTITNTLTIGTNYAWPAATAFPQIGFSNLTMYIFSIAGTNRVPVVNP